MSIIRDSFFLSEFFLSELPFLEFQDEKISFKQFWNLTQNFYLPELDKKEVVGVICQNHPKTLFVIFKLLSLGAIPALISPKATSFEIKNLIAGKIIDPLNITTFSNLEKEGLISLEDIALICFTSGSTGKPKAVPLSFKNIFYSALGTNEFYSLNNSDRYLLTLPLNHVGGIMPVFRSLLAQFSCIFPDKGISFGKYSPSILSLVPTQIFRLAQEEFLKSCKVILVGGDKFPKEKLHMIKHLPVSLTYGMTETCAQVAASVPFETKMKVLPYRKAKISDKGVILVSGETLFTGYLNEKTPIDSDGYFITSDLGELKENSLEVFNRTDDIFIKGGENISSSEIESAALKYDLILSAKIIPVKDDVYGSIPILFYKSKELLQENVLKEHILKYLPSFKIPHRFIQVPNSDDFKWQKSSLLSLMESNQ
jgi:o-succinylbenzoate---CoA ligase